MYRTLYGPQGAHINLDGREIINMASNNYLGLANDPDLVAAAKEAIDKYGVGSVPAETLSVTSQSMTNWKEHWQNSKA